MAPEHRAMNTRIYEGTKQAHGDGRWLQCRPRRADMHTRPRWGLMSAGGLHPNPNVCWLMFSHLRAGHERARTGGSGGRRPGVTLLALIAGTVS